MRVRTGGEWVLMGRGTGSETERGAAAISVVYQANKQELKALSDSPFRD